MAKEVLTTVVRLNEPESLLLVPAQSDTPILALGVTVPVPLAVVVVATLVTLVVATLVTLVVATLLVAALVLSGGWGRFSVSHLRLTMRNSLGPSDRVARAGNGVVTPADALIPIGEVPAAWGAGDQCITACALLASSSGKAMI